MLLILTSVLLILVGSCWLYILPSNFTSAALVMFSPMLGFAFCSIVVGYFIYFSVPFQYLIPLLLGIGIVVHAAVFLLKREYWFSSWRRLSSLGRRDLYIIAAYVLASAVMYIPSLNDEGKLSTPIHVGIDVAGYGISANYLLNWQGKEKLAELLRKHTGESDDEIAAAKNYRSLDFSVEVASEYILKAMRWSYSGVVAALSLVFQLDSIYRLTFILNIFASLGLLAILYQFLVVLNLSMTVCFLTPLLVLYNSNLINVLYQGQLAQYVAEPLFLVFLIHVYNIRNLSDTLSKGEILKRIFFVGIIMASMMPLYNEMVFTSLIFVGLMFGINFILYFKIPTLRSLGDLVGAYIICFSLAFPISLTWFDFLSKHLVHIRVGGWWQPRWSTPPEILGTINPYVPFSMDLKDRHFTIEILSLFFSVIILATLVNLIVRLYRKMDLSFFLAPIAFILVVLVKTRYRELIHNYQYMKAYTFFIPVLVVGFVYALSKVEILISRKVQRYLAYVISAAIVLNGAYYLKYLKDRVFVVPEVVMQNTEKFQAMSHVAFLVERREYYDFLWAGVFPFNWLSRSDDLYLKESEDMPIYIRPHDIRPNVVADPVSNNQYYQFIKTKHKISDFIYEENGVRKFQMPKISSLLEE